MNTFLPYQSFIHSAQSLDNKRLWKQVLECKQLLTILAKQHCYYKTHKIRPDNLNYWGFGGWSNHPALIMWSKHPKALAWYAMACVGECKRRGIAKYTKVFGEISEIAANFSYNGLPRWIGQENFHLAHKSNLIRKLPEHYVPLFGNVPNDKEYIWPKN